MNLWTYSLCFQLVSTLVTKALFLIIARIPSLPGMAKGWRCCLDPFLTMAWPWAGAGSWNYWDEKPFSPNAISVLVFVFNFSKFVLRCNSSWTYFRQSFSILIKTCFEGQPSRFHFWYALWGGIVPDLSSKRVLRCKPFQTYFGMRFEPLRCNWRLFVLDLFSKSVVGYKSSQT